MSTPQHPEWAQVEDGVGWGPIVPLVLACGEEVDIHLAHRAGPGSYIRITGDAAIKFPLTTSDARNLASALVQLADTADCARPDSTTAAALAEAWQSGYWHGTSHTGPLNDATIMAKNPYRGGQQ